jgi:hypothetical protein
VSPVARMSGRRPGRSLPCPPRPVPPWGCPSNRSSGRQASMRPVSRRPGQPGVRTDRPPVSAALPPGCPRRAGPRSGSVWRAAPAGRSGPTCRRVCGRRGRLPASVLTRRGWGGVGRGWLAPGSTVARGRGFGRRPGGAVLALVGRHGRWLSGPGCRPGGGGAWDRAGAHRPRQGVLGRSPAWCPAMGLDQRW